MTSYENTRHVGFCLAKIEIAILAECYIFHRKIVRENKEVWEGVLGRILGCNFGGHTEVR